MKNGWEQKQLPDIAKYFIGLTYSPKDVSNKGTIVPRSSNIQDDKIDLSDLVRVNRPVNGSLKVRQGDILMCSRNGSKRLVGKTAVIGELPEAMTFGTFMTVIRSELNPYLAWFFKSELFRQQIGVGENTMINQVTKYMLDAIQVPLPSPTDQRRIVGLLDEAFEGIATAQANAEENLRNARALFESHLQSVFTQRGDGWVNTSLGEAYDVRDGTHDSPKYHATGYPLITSKNLKREGLSFDNVQLISEQDYNKINERSAVHRNDVLFAMIGTIGNPTLVTVEPNFAIKNVALFKTRKGQSGAFLKYYLGSGWVITKMMQDAKGTTQKFVGLGYLRGFPINLPPLGTQLKVVEELDELSEETEHLESIYERKLAALEELKKSLLHQAFTGKLYKHL
jgi:type I restriction enzyme S subunit